MVPDGSTFRVEEYGNSLVNNGQDTGRREEGRDEGMVGGIRARGGGVGREEGRRVREGERAGGREEGRRNQGLWSQSV